MEYIRKPAVVFLAACIVGFFALQTLDMTEGVVQKSVSKRDAAIQEIDA